MARIGRQSLIATKLLVRLMVHEHSFVRRQSALAIQKVADDPVDVFVRLLRWAIDHAGAELVPFVEELVVSLREMGDRSEEVRKVVMFAAYTCVGRARQEAAAMMDEFRGPTVGEYLKLMAGEFPEA